MGKRALYREYRPITFSEVIGQDHITTILKNQVKEHNFSHAYLFCGSRGTGKTSSAKILSRAVNCLHNENGEPCGKCEACRIALEGTADIIEIDAASNNGVDNVRDLIDQSQFAPLQLNYRVFIIDEVHMLSTAAFNALLKTLEEPPAHVMFILATTEPQKLPATIISRCQRFDFHRLTIAHIISRLDTVLRNVGAEIEPDGLRLIARAADGGMRDALSLADQCLSFCGNHVTKQDVLDTLGSVGQETLMEMAKAVFQQDAAKCLAVLNNVIREGRDIAVFTSDLNSFFRSLLLAKTCGNCSDILDVTEDQMDQLLKIAEKVSESQILYALEKLIEAQTNLRYFSAPRILIEAALVRVCHPVDESTYESLETRISQLEKNGVIVKSGSESVTTISHDIEQKKDLPDTKAERKEIPVVSSVKQNEEKIPANSVEKEEEQKEEQLIGAEESEASIIWNKVINIIKIKNPMVFYLAKEGKGVKKSGSTLTVEFPTGAESKMSMCSASINMNVINSCLNEIEDGLSVVFRSEQLNDKEKKLKSLFGNALTIEE